MNIVGNHALRIVEGPFEVNEFGNMVTVTVSFSSSTSMIRISLPKSNYKSCPISASIHAKDFQFKGNNILHIQLRIFIGAMTL